MASINTLNWTRFLVLISILFLGMGCESDSSKNEKLYQKYYSLPDNPIEKRTIHSGSDLEVGINAFFLGDYEGSKAALKPLVENDKSINLEAYYFYAHSFLATGEYDNAVMYFEAAQERLIHHIEQPAQWYSALALIKKGDRAGARKILKDIIAKANHKFYDQANNLLEELAK